METLTPKTKIFQLSLHISASVNTLQIHNPRMARFCFYACIMISDWPILDLCISVDCVRMYPSFPRGADSYTRKTEPELGRNHPPGIVLDDAAAFALSLFLPPGHMTNELSCSKVIADESIKKLRGKQKKNSGMRRSDSKKVILFGKTLKSENLNFQKKIHN